MKASELDKRFDGGEDITGELDLASARRPNREQRRVNVDFPSWMVESLDREARRLGRLAQAPGHGGDRAAVGALLRHFAAVLARAAVGLRPGRRGRRAW